MKTTRHAALAAPPIMLIDRDFDRLEWYLARVSIDVDALEDELSRAVIVPPSDLPSDVVTVGSRLLYQHADNSAHSREVNLVWPDAAYADASRVSVLSPVGCALLGRRVGGETEVEGRGAPKRLQIVALLHQER